MSIYHTRPPAIGDNPNDSGRGGRLSNYGDRYTVPVGLGRANAASEGSYYTCVNATLATAITGHAAPAIADGATKPIIHLYNGGPRYIDIDMVKLSPVAVNASSTSTDFVVYISQDGASSRASGGTAIVPANCRSDGAASGATVYVGAVIAAPAAAVKVAQWTARPVIAVTEDQYLVAFGGGAMLNAHGVITGTTQASVLVAFPPVTIAPGGNFHFVQIGPSGASTAMTFEFEFGWICR